MNRIALVLTALLTALVITGAAMAQEPFDKKEMNRLIETMPGWLQLVETLGQDLDDPSDPSAWEALMDAKRIQNYLADQGWSDTDRFLYVASHAAMGLGALLAQETQPQMRAEIEESRREIMNNPQLSQEMKEQLLAALEQAQAQMTGLQDMAQNVPPDEMALIKANRNRLEEVFDVDR